MQSFSPPRNAVTAICRRVVFVAAVILLVSVFLRVDAATNSFSSVSGFMTIPIVEGSQIISTPLQPDPVFRGDVASISSNGVTFSNYSSFTSNEFATFTNGLPAYLLIVRSDADQPYNGTNNITGDWWLVSSNTTSQIYVDNRGSNLTNSLGLGDRLEIRPLWSVKNLFGGSTNGFMFPDSDGLPSTTTEDIVRHVNGVSFGPEIFFHDGTYTEGIPAYFYGGDGPLDGSTLTLLPDHSLVYYRKSGAGTTNWVISGSVQSTRLTIFVSSGDNAFGHPFAAKVLVGESNLKESGFITITNFLANSSKADSIKILSGTSYSGTLIYHDGTVNTQGWYTAGFTPVFTNSYPFIPGRAHVYSPKTGSGGRTWRKNPPYQVSPTNEVTDLYLYSPQMMGTNLVLALDGTQTNLAYALYFSTNILSPTNWLPLSTGAVGQFQFTNALPSATNCYFIAFGVIDSDSDGLLDGYERIVSGTDPSQADTDGDGLSDYLELLSGRNPKAGAVSDSGFAVLKVFSPLKP